jgi:hypothetical protein
MTLNLILSWIVHVFEQHGAHHVNLGAVSDHLGWVMSKHWLIRVCRVGTKGCGF